MEKDDRHHDPMRELDLLLLEDIMMRRHFQPTKTAMALQTTCMLLVLLGVGVMFAHTLLHPEVDTAQIRDLGGQVSLNIPVP